MSGPLGDGEKKHPKSGNTTIVLKNLRGEDIRVGLWINQFATDLNMQIDSAQLRTRLVHRPIRLTERFLTFTTLWNARERERHEKFVQQLKTHWAFNFNEDLPTPMFLTYYGANKHWKGFIEAADFSYAVTDVVLSQTYRMRLIPDVTNKVSHVVGGAAPYAPTTQDVKDYGDAWYSLAEFQEELATSLRDQNDGRAPGRNPDRTPADPRQR